MQDGIIKKRLIPFAFEKTPRISLSSKLVPLPYREYKYGLLVKVSSEKCPPFKGLNLSRSQRIGTKKNGVHICFK